MAERKFTAPTQFPAEYVDGRGNRAVILGRSHHEVYPLIGFTHDGNVESWTEDGTTIPERPHPQQDLHDMPKRITTWHNVYEGWVGASNKVNRGATENRLCVYRIERDEDGGNPEIFVEEV
jgi:hypothetical protein